jgi:hypothetical protein
MLHDTRDESGPIATFLDLQPEPERLKNAVERSSADRMRKLEKLEDDEWLKTLGYVQRKAQNKKKRKDIPFVGGGEARRVEGSPV